MVILELFYYFVATLNPRHMIPNAEISKSRSKKNPFKIRVVGKNGEPLMTAELLSTRKNCIKNLLAVMASFRGSQIVVVDKTGKEERRFQLRYDGSEQPIQ